MLPLREITFLLWLKLSETSWSADGFERNNITMKKILRCVHCIATKFNNLYKQTGSLNVDVTGTTSKKVTAPGGERQARHDKVKAKDKRQLIRRYCTYGYVSDGDV